MKSTSKYGNAPAFRHLSGESARALLVQLRTAVAPILDNNILPHFTDHSVSHSDGVTQLVDSLIEPLQKTDERLSETELVVLYSACYLHDIGLQYENAGETRTIAELNLGLPWHDQPESERRNLLRQFHHRISAEMVHSSIRAEAPIIGMQLTDEYEPSKIACLCEAHNLYFEVEQDFARYDELTEDGPGIRMKLLAGLLRVADILEESRRRATRPKAQTLMLDITAQKHWWRHYYTEDVVFNEADRTITLWFDFPPDKLESYSRIIPELQKPWIEAEFNRHAAVFNRYGVTWTLQVELKAKQYSDTQTMPDEVVTATMAELRTRHLEEDERRRNILLSTFRESRPQVESRLNQLREQKEELPPKDYLLKLVEVSNDLWTIGSKRSAVMTLVFEFGKSNQHLDVVKRIEVGTRLMEMCLEDDLPDLAKGWGIVLQETVRTLDAAHPAVFPCLRTIADWFIALCGYEEAKAAIAEAIAAATDGAEVALLNAKRNEVDFLQGELRAVEGETEKDAQDD
ncbi:MAG: HD domain-containing protein [Planctomycetota bacterium]|nr:HD domain-containing protein [Planctomycetota bacterium]